MALVLNNPLTQGLRGMVGNLIVFKQYQGKTIVACKGSKPTKQSAKQRENRNRFKRATQYAQTSMLDAKKKAYYQHKAIELKLPNAYTAAITDYMRHGEIKEVDTKQFKDKVGGVIGIHVKKQDVSPFYHLYERVYERIKIKMKASVVLSYLNSHLLSLFMLACLRN